MVGSGLCRADSAMLQAAINVEDSRAVLRMEALYRECIMAPVPGLGRIHILGAFFRNVGATA